MVTDQLRVGVLAFPWKIPAPAYGGVERAVDGLCRGLLACGHDVRLWSAISSTCPVTRSGVIDAVDNAAGWHGTPDELLHVLSGYEWLTAEAVDIIHDITYSGPLVGPHLVDVPVVTTNYLPFTPPLEGQSSPDLSLIYQTIAKRVPVLAVSQAQARGASGFRPHTILLGIDIDLVPFGNGEGDEYGSYAAFFGRMAPEKGAREAVLAAREAGLRLKIAARVSEAHEHAYFANEVEPLIDSSDIQFVGELSRTDSYDLLKNAAVMVNPIAWPEPLGITMIESLAAGTPVVARRAGAVEEVVTHGVTGAVCDSFDEIVAALRGYKLFDRSACRRSAEEKFSNQRAVTEHIAFYRSVLEGHT